MFKKYISVDYILLLLILLISATLRLYNYHEFSLNNDELSALCRLEFDSFSGLIENGVKPDGHPPLVQVFLYYWTKLFGISEASIRFPFVLCGIFSVYIAFLIGSFWFNRTTALLASAALGILEFPLLYTQLARPYSPGLFFSLLNIWYWTKLLFDDKPDKVRASLYYAITASLCMYTHYFSFLSALITGITGIVFVKRTLVKHYLLSGIIAFLLFAPSLGIFYHHFFEIGGLGGPGGWLGKPKSDFLEKYLFECFNNSGWLNYSIWIVCLLSLIVFFRKIVLSKFHILSIIWFLLPYFIGYYYSIYRSAVLQDKILLFSYPFLLFFVFSFFRDESRLVYKTIIVLTAVMVLLFSTVVDKKYFSTQHLDQFNAISRKIIEYNDHLGEKNITNTVNVHGEYYINYYLNKFERKITFVSYRNDFSESFLKFDSICRNSPAPFFLYAWASTYSPNEILQVIKKHYPYTIAKEYYNRSEVYVFAREKPSNYVEQPPVFYTLNGFEFPVKYWGNNDSVITGEFSFEGVKSVKVDAGYPFGPVFSAFARDIFRSADDIVYSSVYARMEKTKSDVKLCLSFENNGEIYEWHDMPFYHFIDSSETWKKVFLHCRVPELKSKNDIINIFVWNLSNSKVFIDKFEVWVEEGNPILFGSRIDYSTTEFLQK